MTAQDASIEGHDAPFPASPTPEELKYERNFLILLACMMFTHVVDFMVLMPLGPQLIKTFGLTPAGFGAVVSAYTFSAGATSVLAALFLDRFNRKTTMLVTYFGFMVGTLLCGLAPNAHLLLFARIVTGGFGGVMVANVFAMISDVVPVKRRGAAMGTVMTSFSVASIAGIPLALFLANHFTWQMPFFALTAGSAVMWAMGFRALPSLKAPPAHESGALALFGKILATPIHWRSFSFTFAMMGSTFLVIPYISNYLVSNTKVLNGQIPWVFFAGGTATFFTMRFIGRLGDKHGLFKVYSWVTLGAIIPILALTHMGNWGILVALPITTLFMILVSGRSAPGMALVTVVVKPHLRGGFMSLNSALQQIATGAASLAAGWMLTTDASGHMTGYGRVGWFAAAGLLLSIWLASGLKPQTEGRG